MKKNELNRNKLGSAFCVKKKITTLTRHEYTISLSSHFGILANIFLPLHVCDFSSIPQQMAHSRWGSSLIWRIFLIRPTGMNQPALGFVTTRNVYLILCIQLSFVQHVLYHRVLTIVSMFDVAKGH